MRNILLAIILLISLTATSCSFIHKPIGEIYNISVSPNGKMLALSASSGVRVYDLEKNKLLYSFDHDVINQYQGIYSYIAWSPDSADLAIGKPNIGVRIWDASTWKVLTEKGDEKELAYELPGFAWSPDGKKLALGLGQGEILIWDKATNSWITETAYKGRQLGITWAKNGQLIMMEDRGLYEANTGKLIKRLNTVVDGGYSYAIWSSDAKHVYVFFDLGGSIMNIEKNEYNQFGSCCYSEVAWSMDGRYFVATPEHSNEISVWDVVTNKVIERKKQGDSIYAFAWTPSGELLAIGSMNLEIAVWDTKTEKIVMKIGY